LNDKLCFDPKFLTGLFWKHGGKHHAFASCFGMPLLPQWQTNFNKVSMYFYYLWYALFDGSVACSPGKLQCRLFERPCIMCFHRVKHHCKSGILVRVEEAAAQAL